MRLTRYRMSWGYCWARGSGLMACGRDRRGLIRFILPGSGLRSHSSANSVLTSPRRVFRAGKRPALQPYPACLPLLLDLGEQPVLWKVIRWTAVCPHPQS